MLAPEVEATATKIVDAAYTVHTRLGPGLLESVYERCMAYELEKNGCHVRRQVAVPVTYDGLEFEEGYRLDLLVDDLVIVELKALAKSHPIHVAQTLTYLKLLKRRLGLLCYFNTVKIKDGIRRVIL